MPLNISVFGNPVTRNGAFQFAQQLNASASGLAQAVALAAQSVAVVGPCEISLIPDEDQRILVQNAVNANQPTASGIKLKAGIERRFILPQGNFYFTPIAG
jgi:hypothetical protein